MGKKVMCKRAMVIVKRDMAEATPVIVFCHEVPILQAIHGESSIALVPDPQKAINQFNSEGMDEAEIKRQLASRAGFMDAMQLDTAEEYNRLIDRYGMHADVDVPNVEYVYGRPSDIRWKQALTLSIADLQDNFGEGDDEAGEDIHVDEETPAARTLTRAGAKAKGKASQAAA